jgi:transcriptional regulator with XRE-family HTH domain
MRGDPAKGTSLSPSPKTWLNRIRRERAVMQSELASKTGISDRTLPRLENGEIGNPPLRYLVNCALVLGVDWHELVEDEWETWIQLPAGPAAPEPTRANPKLQR